MGLCRYLAMTAAELWRAEKPPEHTAYMACHFSPYGTGLTNRPAFLPTDSMLILNDRTPICSHDPELIATQIVDTVKSLQCGCVLLDFEREGNPETAKLCAQLVRLPITVGVSAGYAQELDCPVFLPPPPLNIPLDDHLRSWSGREIWLETAPDACRINVTADGSTVSTIPWDSPPDGSFSDPVLYCSYKAHVTQNCVFFDLYRSAQDITDLLLQAEALGVTKAIGLYQQFYQISF